MRIERNRLSCLQTRVFRREIQIHPKGKGAKNLAEKSIKEKNNSLINSNERIIRIESPCFYGGKYMILLGFAHREVARKDKKSVKIRQLS